MSLNRVWQVLAAAIFLAAPASAQFGFTGCPQNIQANKVATCTLTLTLGSSQADAMQFLLVVTPSNSSYPLTVQASYSDSINSNNASACSNGCGPTVGSPAINQQAAVYSAIDDHNLNDNNFGLPTILAAPGTSTLGTLQFKVPSTAPVGTTYTVSITGTTVSCCNDTTENPISPQPAATATAVITVVANPVFATFTLPPADSGHPYSFSLGSEVSGGSGTYTSYAVATGTLPSWLTLAAGTGVLSGTPATTTSQIVTSGLSFTVTDSTSLSGTSGTVSLTENPAMSAATGTLSASDTGIAYPPTGGTNTISFTGGSQPFTWSATLPSGLSFANSDATTTTGSDTITGIPTATHTGTVTITITDAAGASITYSPTLTINSQPTYGTVPTSIQAGDVGFAYPISGTTVGPTATGGTGTLVYSATVGGGSAPLSTIGLSINSSTGAITGTPVNPTGIYTINWKVTDAVGATGPGTNGSNIPINAALSALTPTTAPGGSTQNPYSGATISTANGSSPYTWSISAGIVPAGLSFNAASSTGTSVQITGTPSSTAVSETFTVKVVDGAGASVTQQYTITITSGPTISFPTGYPLPATVGKAYPLAATSELTASGGQTPYTWTLTAGTLPAGFNGSITAGTNFTTGVSGSNNQFLTIGGTPTAACSGTNCQVTITVKDSTGATASQVLAFVVDPAPAFTNSTVTLPTATVAAAYTSGTAVSGDVTTGTGAPPLVYSVTSGSTLPSPLQLNSATGAITGTLTAVPSPNPASFSITVTDANLATASATFSLPVNPQLKISTTTIPAATAGGTYLPSGAAFSLAASGGSGTYTTFSLASGSLDGLTLTTTGITAGAITGTPTTSGTFTPGFTVTDSNGVVSAVTTLTLTVNAALNITTASPIPGITANNAYMPGGAAFTFAATGGTGALTWSLVSPPTGVTISSGGVLSTNVSTTGGISITVQVTDADGATLQKTFTSTVYAAPTFTTTSLPTATVGDAFGTGGAGFQVVESGGTPTGGTTGNPTFTWHLSNLPAGASAFVISNTGLITGTPTATTGSGSNVSITLTDNNGVAATPALTPALTIDPAVTITLSPTTLPQGIQGVAYTSTTITAGAGFGSGYTVTVTGLTGSGLTFSGGTNGQGGSISGTPTAAGTYALTITATDGATPPGSTTLHVSLVINPPLSFTGGSLPTASLGAPYSATVTAAGGQGPYTYTAANLPAGLAISTSGVISGAVTSAAGSPFTIQVTAKDATGKTVTASFTLTVSSTALALLTSQLPDGVINQVYARTNIQATGGSGTYTWTITGLPPGLSTDGNGTIFGTPTTVGSYNIAVTITDAAGNTVNKTYQVTIHPTLSVSGPATLPAATLNVGYGPVTITDNGGLVPYSFTATGLPAGMSMSSNGIISGTPTTATGSPYTVVVTTEDSTGKTATMTYTLVVNSPLTVTGPASLPTGMVGTAYTSTTITASGGSGTYTFSASGLPAGLSIASSSGAITGTPGATSAGTFTVTVTVTDTLSNTANKNYTLTINPATSVTPTITSVSTVAGGQPQISPNTWVAIYGTNFEPATFTSDTWTHLLTTATTPLPTTLDNVSVSVGGMAAYVYYVSPTQIDVLTPNIGLGPLQVTVTNATVGTSNAVTATSQTYIPALFPWPPGCNPQTGTCNPVATHENYTYAVANGTIPNLVTVPAAPGETIILWGSGFGPTTPAFPFGVAIPATPTYDTSSNVTVLFNNAPLTVYQNLAFLASGSAGLFQIAVTLPATIANGSYPLTVSIGSVTSPTYMLTVQAAATEQQ